MYIIQTGTYTHVCAHFIVDVEFKKGTQSAHLHFLSVILNKKARSLIRMTKGHSRRGVVYFLRNLAGKIKVVLILDYHQTTHAMNTEAMSSERSSFSAYQKVQNQTSQCQCYQVGVSYQSEASDFHWLNLKISTWEVISIG